FVAGGIGLYIVGVTWFARTEASESNRIQLSLATATMLAGLALLAWFPSWAAGTELPVIETPNNWYLFWVVIAALISRRALQAIRDPQPRYVQAAVKHCIMSLIVIDAGAAIPALDSLFWALVILSLLVPALLLGRWIYST